MTKWQLRLILQAGRRRRYQLLRYLRIALCDLMLLRNAGLAYAMRLEGSVWVMMTSSSGRTYSAGVI